MKIYRFWEAFQIDFVNLRICDSVSGDPEHINHGVVKVELIYWQFWNIFNHNVNEEIMTNHTAVLEKIAARVLAFEETGGDLEEDLWPSGGEVLQEIEEMLREADPAVLLKKTSMIPYSGKKR